MQLDLSKTETWTVLVVDDEPDNLELISDVLQYYGARVAITNTGVAALTLLPTLAPNMIILDLGMPKMNGWQLRELIRELSAFAQTPILALSAHAMVGDRERVLAAGFDGYLSKPINVSTIIEDIRGALEIREE